MEQLQLLASKPDGISLMLILGSGMLILGYALYLGAKHRRLHYCVGKPCRTQPPIRLILGRNKVCLGCPHKQAESAEA